MTEWLAALAVFLLLISLLPALLRRTRGSRAKSGGSGVWIGLGLAFAMIFDPKAAQAMEIVDRKQDESEDGESGDQP